MPLAFFLAMQAAGMVVDYLGKQDQIGLARQGAKLEQQGIESNIMASRLEAEDASLMAMKKLRQNLGTQAAVFAARGQRAGTGNALIIANESVGNFNADDRMRKLNQTMRENELKSGKTISKLHQSTYESDIWNQFTKSTINRIPTSPQAWDKLSQGFGFTKA